MMHYLSRLAARAAGEGPLLAPRPRLRFEPRDADLGTDFAVPVDRASSEPGVEQPVARVMPSREVAAPGPPGMRPELDTAPARPLERLVPDRLAQGDGRSPIEASAALPAPRAGQPGRLAPAPAPDAAQPLRVERGPWDGGQNADAVAREPGPRSVIQAGAPLGPAGAAEPADGPPAATPVVEPSVAARMGRAEPAAVAAQRSRAEAAVAMPDDASGRAEAVTIQIDRIEVRAAPPPAAPPPPPRPGPPLALDAYLKRRSAVG